MLGEGATMITLTKTFSDPELMDTFIKSYLKEFAPAGYSTSVDIQIIQSYDDWKANKLKYEVTFERFESCD